MERKQSAYADFDFANRGKQQFRRMPLGAFVKRLRAQRSVRIVQPA